MNFNRIQINGLKLTHRNQINENVIDTIKAERETENVVICQYSSKKTIPRKIKEIT